MLTRWARWLLLSVAGLVLLLVLALAALYVTLAYQPQRAVPAIEWGAGRVLGRPLRIGELSDVVLATESSLVVRDLTLANAPWAGPRPLVQLPYLKLSLNLPSLWGDGSVLVRTVEARGLSVDLQAPADREPNWVLPLQLPFSSEADEPDDVLFPVIIEYADLADVTINYRDPDQVIDVSVATLSLSRDDQSGMSTLDLVGEVNDLPLSGAGLIGPNIALQTGRDLSLDLELQLARLEVSVEGSFSDALALSGTDLLLRVHAPDARPILDILGMPEVRDGPLSFDGRIADARPGLQIEAEGRLAEFDLSAHGVVQQPLLLDGVDLELFVEGPSLAEAGAIVGLHGFRPVPFAVSARVQRRGSVFTIEDGWARAAQGELRLSGTLPNFPRIDDGQATLTGHDLNLAVLGSLLGSSEFPPLLFAVDGQLSIDENGLELVNLTLDEGDILLNLQGRLGEPPGFAGTVIDARYSGSDLSLMQGVLGIETLPPRPFELSGQLLRAGDIWRVENALLQVEGMAVRGSGAVEKLFNPVGATASLSFTSADLPVVLREFGVDVETRAPLPIDISLDTRLEEGGLKASNLQGQVGIIAVSGEGWVSTTRDLAGSRLKIEGRGDSLGASLAVFVDADLPGRPFHLSLDAVYLAPLFQVDDFSLVLGQHRLGGHLQVSGRGASQVARGKLTLQGPDTRDLLLLAGIDVEAPREAYHASTDVEMRPERLLLQNIDVDGPDNDLAGSLSLRFGEVPRLDVDLYSRQLYTPFLWPEPPPKEAAASSSGTAMDPPTRQQMAERIIPDEPLPLEWLNAVEGHWRYRVDRAMAREDLATSVTLDLIVEKGVLDTKELRWQGPVSTGWLDLGVDATAPQRRLVVEMVSHRLPLLWLLAGGEVPEQQAYYRARVAGAGATYRELAASLNGALLFRNSGARVSNRGLDLILGDVLGSVFNRLDPTTKTEEFTRLRCGAGALRLKDGLVSIAPGLVMRLDAVDIVAGGALDLNTEALDITFNTRSRKGIGISAGKAITPYLKLAGNLANPWITLDPQAVAISGTVAVATGGISILAESLLDRWVITTKNPCKELFKEIRRDTDYQALLALPGPKVDSADADAFNTQAPGK